MGQQQLLLIVLGTIIVGVAVIVGINMFTTGAINSERDGKVLQVNELLTNLLEYQSSEELVSSGVPANLNKHMLSKTSSSPDNPV